MVTSFKIAGYLAVAEIGDVHKGYLLFADMLRSDAGAMYVTDKDGIRHRILFNFSR